MLAWKQMDESCSGINVGLRIRRFLTAGGTQFCSRYWLRMQRRSIVSMLASIAVIGVLGRGTCNGGAELVICEGNASPICVRDGGLSQPRHAQVGKGKLSLAVTVLKASGWEYVLNRLASSPGWRIHVIKWSFNLCFIFNLWMSLLLWSLTTLIFMFVVFGFFFPLGIFMASVTVVSQCLPSIYGFILRTFLWGRWTLSL